MKITVLDGHALNPGDLSWEALSELGDLKVYDHTEPSELLDRAKGSEILITNKTVLDGEAISKLPELRYIGVLATGYNVVDTEAAKEAGVIVTNIPAYSTMSVAQHVFALLLAVTDHVEHYTTQVLAGAWSRCKDFCFWNTPLIELAGKRMGVVGYGNIGKAVTQIAKTFGLKVGVVTSKDTSELPEGVDKWSMEELLRESDIISLHCPLTPATKEMINDATISKMKKGVILINTGRGPLIGERAVAEALKSGHIGAFCADVLSSEPPSVDNPLLNAPNVYITPHIAWATLEARQRLMAIAVENVKRFIEGHPVNVVNR